MSDDHYRLTVTATTPLSDTEVTERVCDVITNIFPSGELTVEADRVVGTTHSVDHFSELLHRQEILDTARSVLFDGRQGDTISFRLKKQAAFVERVNFAVGDPDELGEVDVHIAVDTPDVETVIDQIAPPTEDGRPISPQ